MTEPNPMNFPVPIPEDRVPVRIEPSVVALAGVKEATLLRYCQDYSIVYATLREMVDIKREFGSNMPTLLDFYGKGLTPHQISELCEARRTFQVEKGAPSLNIMYELHITFGEAELDHEILVGKMWQIHDALQKNYVGSSLTVAIRAANETGLNSIEGVLDYLGPKINVSDDYSAESRP